ncbi:unnamed protein product (macronuclear) [Paramecium tetraurelia]|uniref:Tyrosine-protein phosphatase domain-containing protein n=1 Tax=Paramecium tetraurelia TaxID=5888 RepID=A0BZT9_PARTE|nr:uncharacterized protein GSPATT00005908001 [Paramecium tetraurelia]CAK64056.1 unnamed protein product [Paramecium tetraurelia]|eukprot:XP_001431454.1 hypothetical protein (macronuclear) [Paramecium tetraurelia strain d4-2]
MSLILQNLYLGGVNIAKDIKFIKEKNIKYILICAKGIQQYYPNKVQYKQLNISDNPCTLIITYLPESLEFINQNIKNAAILVHCLGGKSRSVSVVIAYVMFSLHVSYEQAFQHVKQHHFQAQPNVGFIKQLNIFQTVLEIYGKPKQNDFKVLNQIMYDNNIESQVKNKLNQIQFKNNYEIEQNDEENDALKEDLNVQFFQEKQE